MYVVEGDGIVEVPRVGLTRTGDDTSGFAWCLGAEHGVEVPGGDVSLLDNHDVDWRLFPVDDAGCVYRLAHANGDWWTSPTPGLPVSRDREIAPGRSWVSVEL